jgi:mono/diheme cytochrome c family protein
MRSRFICLFLLAIACISVFEACQNEEQLTYARYYVNGRNLYIQHCQNCHNTDGKGLGNLYPPLTDTVFLKNNRNHLACIIKHGLKGPITIAGKTYEGEMPAESQMPDIEIAALVTYITNSFGNKQGLYSVTEAGKDLHECNR